MSAITCPKCSYKFSKLDQLCKKCSGLRVIKTPIYKKMSAALKQQGINHEIINYKETICPRCNGAGTEGPNFNRNNRKRGASNEYKAVDILTTWWTGPNGESYEFRKTPQSGGSVLASGFDLAGDICTTAPDFPWSIECKRTAIWDFGQLLNRPHEIYGAMRDYFSQCVADTPSHKHPLLWLQHPGPSQPTYIIIIGKLDMLEQQAGYNLPILYGYAPSQYQSYRYYLMGLDTLLCITPKTWRMVYNIGT